MPDRWITKREAIKVVWRAQAAREDTTGSAASAATVLRAWKRQGLVRTKPAPQLRTPQQKYDPVVFCRVDLAKRLDERVRRRPNNQPIGDDGIAELVRLGQLRKRRQELGIATLGRPNPPGATAPTDSSGQRICGDCWRPSGEKAYCKRCGAKRARYQHRRRRQRAQQAAHGS